MSKLFLCRIIFSAFLSTSKQIIARLEVHKKISFLQKSAYFLRARSDQIFINENKEREIKVIGQNQHILLPHGILISAVFIEVLYFQISSENVRISLNSVQVYFKYPSKNINIFSTLVQVYIKYPQLEKPIQIYIV